MGNTRANKSILTVEASQLGWTLDRYRTTQQSVEDVIRHHCPSEARAPIYEFIFQQIDRLAEDRAPLRRLELFAYVMYALRLQSSRGGLRSSVTGELFELARNLLKERGVTSNDSRMAPLIAEIYATEAQISLRQGMRWQAQIKGLVSHYYKAPESVDLSLSLAIRAGDANLVLALCASKPALSGQSSSETALIRARAFVWLGRRAEAVEELKAVEKPFESESRWLRLLIRAIDEGKAEHLAVAFKARGEHRSSDRIVEAYLIQLASASAGAAGTTPLISSIARDTRLGLRVKGLIFRLIDVLQSHGRQKFRHEDRVEALAEILSDIGTCASLDQECLGLAAIARAFARARAYGLAELALTRYVGNCMRASGGACVDVFGVVGDLLDKNWYRGPKLATLSRSA